MKTHTILLFVLLYNAVCLQAQDVIPLDTVHWKVEGNYLFENYKGKDAIYLKSGSITLNDRKFLNGTIEFDLYLKEDQMFPGLYFRATEEQNAEQNPR